jgi:Na+/proline symporter
MSDISLDFGPFGWAFIILIIGAPGLLIGAALGAISWRRHRLYGALIGAVVGLVLWDAGFVFWKASPWG